MPGGTSKPLVRPADAGDARRIAEIHVRSWQAAYVGMFPQEYLDGLTVEARLEKWRAWLAPGSPAAVFVEEDATGITGWIDIGPSRDPDTDQTVGEVLGIYVDPPSWGGGVGRALWAAALAFARSRGWTRLILWTLDANVRARRFYEGLGMVHDPADRRMYQRDGHSAPAVRYSIAVPAD